MLPKAVLFDRDPGTTSRALAHALKVCNVEGFTTANEDELLQHVNFSPECMIVVSSPSIDSQTVRLISSVRRADHHCSLLVLIPAISIEAAVLAMQAGVSDLLEQSASTETMVSRLNALLARHRECALGRSTACEQLGSEKLVGSSSRMRQVRRQLAMVAQAEANVLITGESGTGKELVAELIHQNSRRRMLPFVAVNCAALPDSLLESELFGCERGAFTGAAASRDGKLQHAADGTLFLDEVGDMSLPAQAKILRAVDRRVVQRLGSNVETRVRARLIAATNQNLELLIEEKKFRQDLYYRLNVAPLTMPPLREHLEDIPEIVEHIMSDLAAQQQSRCCRVEAEVIHRFQLYRWPGNVRELRNLMESILVFSSSSSISVCDIPSEIRHRLQSSKPPYSDERMKILGVLDSANWNRNEAAKILGCSRMTLYRKMVKHAIPIRNREMPQAS